MERERSPVANAVRELRHTLGESQQSFAYRMHTAVRTIARWETVRPPKARDTLSALADLAVKNNRYDLANTFLPPSMASIIVDAISRSGSPGILSDAPGNTALNRSVCLTFLAGVLDNPVWHKAIADAVRMLDGPQHLEVSKALDIFTSQIESIQRDLRANSVSAENAQDPGNVKPLEGVK